MPVYHTLKIPKKLHDIFEKYIENEETVFDTGTAFTQDVIRKKAEELLKKLKEKEKLQ